MAEHTKLPWKLEVDQHFGPGFVITSTDGGMHNRCPVVRMSSPLGEDDETLRGDAELIVKACNSHDALVKALRECVQDIVFCERVRDPSFNPRSLGVGTVLGDAIAALDAVDGAALPSQRCAPESDAQSLETREVQS